MNLLLLKQNCSCLLVAHSGTSQ